jgi:oligoendopeptidase F
MFATLPQTTDEFKSWTWAQIAPFYDELLARPLTAANVEQWLLDWTKIAALIDELNTRFTIATTTNTADTEAEAQYKTYLDEIVPPSSTAEQKLKQKLLDSGLEPAGFAIPLRNLRGEAAIYRDENLPLLAEVRKLSLEYDQISGKQTVLWQGAEIPLTRLQPFLEDPDREVREQAWRARFGRIVQDEAAYAEVWRKLVTTRRQIAKNAGFANFREYRWQQLHRFDYTPEDAKRFDATIEQINVPASARLAEKRRQQLGVTDLRAWDMLVDPLGQPPLRPAESVADLVAGLSRIFNQLDPQLGAYFDRMRAENLLDLEARPNKAPGGYLLEMTASRKPFIYMNAVGTHDDVVTLLHEGGHAFHAYEAGHLRYLPQYQEQAVPAEFAEVASIAMEFLGPSYLTTDRGGFYTEAEANRARADQYRGTITFWSYMAMIDALQQWVYEHEDIAADLNACDDYWESLVDRYWPYLDWSGLQAEKRAYWHRQSHVFQDPFYYIDYGIASLGAVQIWANAQRDQAAALTAYRRALALGGTASLPELFAAAGAKFAFDAETLQTAVGLLEQHIDTLESAVG